MKFILLLVFVASGFCFADDVLRVGDPAPLLTIERWMRGEPVMQFEKGKVYVVEFWATWCGPCVRMMPHLIEFQKKYADQGLRVIGVGSREDTPDRAVAEETIEKFLSEKFPEINYAIAFEHGGLMNKAWLDAGLARGIPHSFVIDREGKIAFIGHPAFLDPLLPQILDGTYDYADAKQKDEERIKRDQPSVMERRVLKPIMASINEAEKAEDWARALSLTEAGLAAVPENPTLWVNRVELLLHRLKDFPRGKLILKEFVEWALKKEDDYAAFQGLKQLIDPAQDFSYLPRQPRMEAAKALAEKVLAMNPPEEGNAFVYYPPVAAYYVEEGNKARAIELLQISMDSLLKIPDERRPQMIERFGMQTAKPLADLKGEPVCIGDLCVLPSLKTCEGSITP